MRSHRYNGNTQIQPQKSHDNNSQSNTTRYQLKSDCELTEKTKTTGMSVRFAPVRPNIVMLRSSALGIEKNNILVKVKLKGTISQDIIAS